MPARVGVGVRIDIWSDVVCPFCYIGKRRLEQVLAASDIAAADVEVVFHSFELDPAAPAEAGSHSALLAAKYGMSSEQVAAADASMTQNGASVGIDFRLADSRPANSFDAHRLLHLAERHGVQAELKERLLRAYFTDGKLISDQTVLTRLAAEAGIDEAEARAALDSGAFADDVRRDEQTARDLGITGVPFFVFDRRLAVSGAQPAEIFREALRQTRATPVATS